MKKIVNLFFLLIVFQLFSQKNLLNEQLIIVPEKSNFEKTSSYADVMLFINEIQNQIGSSRIYGKKCGRERNSCSNFG
jgi:hypothetical protein